MPGSTTQHTMSMFKTFRPIITLVNVERNGHGWHEALCLLGGTEEDL